jgi:phosphoglycolate phosphatase-like HAD superfamily hydrolase
MKKFESYRYTANVCRISNITPSLLVVKCKVILIEIPHALANLSNAGVPMAVCTSKRKDFAEKILEMFRLLGFVITKCLHVIAHFAIM